MHDRVQQKHKLIRSGGKTPTEYYRNNNPQKCQDLSQPVTIYLEVVQILDILMADHGG